MVAARREEGSLGAGGAAPAPPRRRVRRPDRARRPAAAMLACAALTACAARTAPSEAGAGLDAAAPPGDVALERAARDVPADDGALGPSPCTPPVAPPADAAIAVGAPDLCTAGLCWENPRPSGTPIAAAWPTSDGAWWLVGDAGTILRVTPGGAWERVASGTGVALHSIWGAADDDIWIVGSYAPSGRATLHWDGARWSAVDQPTFLPFRVHGSARDDVWSLGANGSVGHWDGASWREVMADADFAASAVWAVGPADAWIGGTQGRARHWDGARWTETSTGVRESLTTLWASAGDDVWAGGVNGTLLHWDGHAWRVVRAAPSPPRAITSISGAARDDVWAVAWAGTVLHWDGTSWTAVSDPALADVAPLLSGVRTGARPGEVWVFGTEGALVRRQDGRWSRVDAALTRAHLHDVWGTAVDDVWAVGAGGTLLHRDAARWAPVAVPTREDLQRVWGAAPDDVWAAGGHGVALHWDGAAWTCVETPTRDRIDALWGRAHDEVWAGTFNGELLRFDGRAWTSVWRGRPITDIAGVGPRALWISAYGSVQTNAIVTRFEDGRAEPVPGGGWTEQFWVVGPSDIWSAGRLGTLTRWDGATWTPQTVTWPPRQVPVSSLYAIAGTSAGDEIYAAGDEGQVVRCARGECTSTALGASWPLFGLWVAPSGDVFSVGMWGTIVHRPP